MSRRTTPAQRVRMYRRRIAVLQRIVARNPNQPIPSWDYGRNERPWYYPAFHVLATWEQALDYELTYNEDPLTRPEDIEQRDFYQASMR